jgi:hypothetical protein
LQKSIATQIRQFFLHMGIGTGSSDGFVGELTSANDFEDAL